MRRAIAYIDGFNLYFGLRSKGWKRYYWLDVRKLAERLLMPDQVLSHTKYFTSRVKGNPEKSKRQNIYLEALETLSDFSIYHGKYLINNQKCLKCGAISPVPSEKMTDVNIAVEMLVDAYQDSFDTAILVSADSDLTGPVLAVRTLFPEKHVVIAFPPNRASWDLKRRAHTFFTISRNKLKKSQFPREVSKPDGYVLVRPTEWN